ncbi:MAG TPA: zf-HC2 domain-containing protein [Gemmatimonadaceae bacterium]
MNDCSNADIRDRLPDLLHERLDVSARATVFAHVADCTDCREELELLREVRAVLAVYTPRIDIGSVVSALPKAPSRAAPARSVTGVGVGPSAATARRRMHIDWRIAAAVTFLAAGGGSVLVMHRTPVVAGVPTGVLAPQVRPADGSALAATTPQPARADQPSVTGAAPVATESVATLDDQAAADVAPGGRLANLNEQQLKTLLGEIDHLAAVPVTEPEPVAMGVGSAVPSVPDGT